ncbi:MAG: endonuclease/exonuclease/phosphatase family protein, partial [Planctomycetota bacterium]
MTTHRILALAGLALATVAACVGAEEWAGTRETPARADTVVRIASYNVLNLFDDVDDPSLEGDADDCHSRDKTVRAKPVEQNEAAARAIREIDADVVALQEIESFDALIKFREEHLRGLGYDHVASVDVGYHRGVEQSVISRFPIKDVRVWPGAELGGVHPELWNGRPNRFAGDTLRWRRSPLMVTVEVPAG